MTGPLSGEFSTKWRLRDEDLDWTAILAYERGTVAMPNPVKALRNLKSTGATIHRPDSAAPPGAAESVLIVYPGEVTRAAIPSSSRSSPSS